MSRSPERVAQLERDLRAAARAFDDVPVAGDAWQQNQRRLAADRGRRGRRLLAVAAAVVLVLAVGGLLLSGGTGGNETMPAGGGDPFGDSVVLGPPVQVETLHVDGMPTAHEAVLSDRTGEGPNLCDRYVGGTAWAGRCTSREPDADDPGIAFDWLTGTSDSRGARGVLAGVDSRVMKVQIWMSNGDETLAVLKPGTWDGTKLFAFTVPAGSPPPQRLVAYSDAGTVLQAVDLGKRFGSDYLPPGSQCNELGASADLPGVKATVSGEPGFADIVLELPGTSVRTVCLPLTGTAQAATAGADDVVVVTAPEVAAVRLNGPGATRDPVRVQGTIWTAWVVHAASTLTPDDRIDVLDARNHVLDKVLVAALS
jgi:hypothetical protein